MITKIEIFSAQLGVSELSLGGPLAGDDPVHIRDVQGLGPVKAEIATTPFATSDGVLFQGASIGARNIVLTMGFNPAWEDDQTISSLRQILYGYLLPKAWTKLRFHSDDLPVVDIEGYVESLEPNIFSQDPEMTCSIICPKPDFIDPDAILITGTVDDGTIENEIEYIGTVPTGIELRVQNTVANIAYTGPLLVNINNDDDEFFQIDPVTIDADGYFKLSSIANMKRAQNVDPLDDSVTNLLTHVTAISGWPRLRPGTNILTVVAEENDQAWTLAYFNRFGGL